MIIIYINKKVLNEAFFGLRHLFVWFSFFVLPHRFSYKMITKLWTIKIWTKNAHKRNYPNTWIVLFLIGGVCARECVCAKWLSLNFLLTLISVRFICIFSMQRYDWWWHSADLMIVFPFWFHSTDWSFDLNKHPTQFQHAKMYSLFIFSVFLFDPNFKTNFFIHMQRLSHETSHRMLRFSFFSTWFFQKYSNWF